MDHDANAVSTERRLGALERFLDTEAPGWRTGEHRSRRYEDSPLAAIAHPDMHVDEDQTLRDRRALGLDRSAERPQPEQQPEQQPQPEQQADLQSGTGMSAALSQEETAYRTALLAQLEPFKGMDGVAPWDGTERTDQLESILANARARKAVMDSASSET